MSAKSNFFGFSIGGLTGRKAVKNNHGLINCECLVAKLYITNLADRHWLLVFSREWLAGWLAGKKMEHLLSCLESQMAGKDI